MLIEFSDELRHFGDVVDVSPVLSSLVGVLGWVVPAFSAFDVKAQVVHGLPVGVGFVLTSVLYAAAYVAGLLGAGVILFSRREFQ